MLRQRVLPKSTLSPSLAGGHSLDISIGNDGAVIAFHRGWDNLNTVILKVRNIGCCSS